VDEPVTTGYMDEPFFAFDSGFEGLMFQAYAPGEAADPTYDTIASRRMPRTRVRRPRPR
jgi:hypothetical protein